VTVWRGSLTVKGCCFRHSKRTATQLADYWPSLLI